MDFLRSKFLPFLKQLTIHGFMTTEIFGELEPILRQEQRRLHKINLSHNDMNTKLSKLLQNGFPELNTLILSNCNLNCSDLHSLAEAKAKGKIPELEHLDMSLNDEIRGHLDLLFDNSPSSSWNSLLSLNVERSITQTIKDSEQPVCSPDLSLLSKKPSLLGNLREVRVSAINNRHMCMTSRWGCLTTLQVVCDKNNDSGILSSVAAAVEDNLLPRLETLRIVKSNIFRYVGYEEKITKNKSLAMLRAANIAVLEYKLNDEKRLANVGVNSFPFKQSTTHAGE